MTDRFDEMARKIVDTWLTQKPKSPQTFVSEKCRGDLELPIAAALRAESQRQMPSVPDQEENAFIRVCAVLDALPAAIRIEDKKPLAHVLPGAWPTMGDLRKLSSWLRTRLESNGEGEGQK